MTTPADSQNDPVADQLEIMRLKAQYCRFSDNLDIDGMLSRFVPDVQARYAPDSGFTHGIDALRGFYHSEVDRTVASLHLVSNFEIDFPEPDRAAVRCALHSWKRFDDEAVDRERYAHYVEEWVRTPEGWMQSKLDYVVVAETGVRPPRRGLENLPATLRDARKHLL